MEILLRASVSFPSREIKDFQKSASALLQSTSWLDLWFAAVSKTFSSLVPEKEKPLFRKVCKSEFRALQFQYWQMATIYDNLLLLQRDIVLNCCVNGCRRFSSTLRFAPVLSTPAFWTGEMVQKFVDRRRLLNKSFCWERLVPHELPSNRFPRLGQPAGKPALSLFSCHEWEAACQPDGPSGRRSGLIRGL